MRWASSSSNNNNGDNDGDNNTVQQCPITDPVQFLQQGDKIENWDAYELLWMNALEKLYVNDTLKHTTGGSRKRYGAAIARGSTMDSGKGKEDNSSDFSCIHPLLVVSHGCTHSMGNDTNNNKKELAQLTEFMMETVGTKALFVAPTPMVAAFSHGRQTCLVVDVGAGGTRVTPVVDGLLLHQAQRRSGRGGDWLSHVAWHASTALPEQQLIPRYQVAAAKFTATTPPSDSSTHKRTLARDTVFHRWAMQDLLYELRTCEHVALPQWWYDPTVPFAFLDNNNNASTIESPAATSQTATGGEDSMDIAATSAPGNIFHELPDGTRIDLTTRIGKDICRLPELLFSETCPFELGSSGSNIVSPLSEHCTLSNAPLHMLVHESLSAVADVDIRKDLAASVLLTGGVSVVKNLEKRLSLELPRITSAAYKPKVLASRFNEERQSAAWIGGSILTSLGSFQQLWLSKTEYEEYGTTLAVQRFP